eukprot:scaffold75352_cov20-Tisochrysis_lutea.AAC.1
MDALSQCFCLVWQQRENGRFCKHLGSFTVTLWNELEQAGYCRVGLTSNLMYIRTFRSPVFLDAGGSRNGDSKQWNL